MKKMKVENKKNQDFYMEKNDEKKNLNNTKK